MTKVRFIIAVILVLSQGCAGLYFWDAGEPPEAPRYTLDEWPYDEFWTGIVFNGDKIGFTHLTLEPAGSPDTFLIRSEASMQFDLMGTGKEVKLLAEDWVNPDLSLRRFFYDYDLDGNHLKLTGEVTPNVLTVTIESAGGTTEQTYPLEGPVYPTSVINLYPVHNGLHLEAEYEYTVYDGESQQLTTVKQDVVNYEQSDLFQGPAYRVKTSMQDNDVTTWINARAEPLLEMSMNGGFISGMESEYQAKRYLTQAALNKYESLLNFSLVPTDRPVESPRETSRLEIELKGADAIAAFPDDERQQCSSGAGGSMLCRIDGSRSTAPRLSEEARESYLATSVAVPTRHPTIRIFAEDISAKADTDLDKLRALLQWMRANIKPEVADVFSALDVLAKRKAECQGYSFLFASFARSLGIPTRVVNGIVYSEAHPGFLYHTWVESLVDGHWQAIDPTFGQLYADATHIKLVEGESLADLAPLLDVLGRLSARIVAVDTD